MLHNSEESSEFQITDSSRNDHSFYLLVTEEYDTVLNDNIEGYQSILFKWWEQIDEHDQKLFKKALPGKAQDHEETQNLEKDDLSKYEPQKIEDRVPQSFSMLVLFPTKVDISICKAPKQLTLS